MTVFIEDLVIQLGDCRALMSSYDSQVITSFIEQFFSNIGFTEKQSILAIKLIKKYKLQLELKIGKNIDPFIQNPQYKHPLRILTSMRSIKITVNEAGVKEIEAKFPYDENIITKIRQMPTTFSKRWDRAAGSWFFDLNEESIKFLVSTFDNQSVRYDGEFQSYVDQSKEIIDNMENYAPILTHDLIIKNPTKNLPKITAIDVIGAAFQARRMGVTLWDERIDQYLNHEYTNTVAVKFLRNDITKSFDIFNDFDSTQCLELVVKHLGPTLFVIPGGAELEKTKLAYNILRGMGLEEKNISVLFRLPAETGKNFNEFVKNNQLNSPISDETRVVFVSNKLPKTIAKSGIKINSIVNMGFNSAHYSLKNFVKNHQNYIVFDQNQRVKEI
jgi:hypothetical protein